jgi:acyl-CoA thioesterase
MNPDDLARQVGESMFSADTASRETMGMELVSCTPGRAVLRMTVRELHLNGHRICHGGFIFTLADSTFAFACNTYNQRTVAQHCAVTFLASGKLGDRLIARGVERQRAGRSGIYDITVTREDGTVIAEFRGHSRTIEGTLLPAEKA